MFVFVACSILGGCEIGEEGAEVIAKFLGEHLDTLKVVGLGLNEFGNAGVKTILDAFSGKKNCVEKLVLDENDLEEDAIDFLLEANLPALKVLSLKENMDLEEASDEKKEELAAAPKEFVALEVSTDQGCLHMWCRDIHVDKFMAIAEQQLSALIHPFAEETELARMGEGSFSVVLGAGAVVKDICLAEEFMEVHVRPPIKLRELEKFGRKHLEGLVKSTTQNYSGRAVLTFGAPGDSAAAFDLMRQYEDELCINAASQLVKCKKGKQFDEGPLQAGSDAGRSKGANMTVRMEFTRRKRTNLAYVEFDDEIQANEFASMNAGSR